MAGPSTQRVVTGRIRAAGLAVAGLVAFAWGTATGFGHLIFNGPAPADLPGVALMVAGAASTALGLRAAFQVTRRRTKALVGLPLAVVLLQFWLLPVVLTGTIATNAPHDSGPRASTLGIAGAQNVRFRASDGVRLAGWLVPGTRRTAVIVLHGSHGTRASTTRWIRLLHGAGFPVLAYDARGHGASGGHENAYGWYGDRDIAGAAAFLRGRGIQRVAALGVSMGAEEALRAAANGVALAAVIADGAGGSTGGDMRIEQGGGAIFDAVTWVGMRAVELFSGDNEPPSLAGMVHRIHAPVLLIASSRRYERRIDSEFARRIGPAAQLWYVPDAGHTQAFTMHPAAYRDRVLGFLADALR